MKTFLITDEGKFLIIGEGKESGKYYPFSIDSGVVSIVEDKLNNGILSGWWEKIDIIYKQLIVPDIYDICYNKFRSTVNGLNNRTLQKSDINYLYDDISDITLKYIKEGISKCLAQQKEK